MYPVQEKLEMAKKILFVFGTRPEVIKMAPVIELARQTDGLEVILCATAQHRYLLDQALSEFDIKPDIDLDLMKPGQSLHDVASLVLGGVEKVYEKVKPDIALVQGDTSTVFAASLAAYYKGIDIGHIEAGLRSRDNRNPFPEEINRKFVSLVARYNFCPTQLAKENLVSESVDPGKIFVTGNTVIDALERTRGLIKNQPPAMHGVAPEFLRTSYVLITGHRRENFDGGIKNICEAIRDMALKNTGLNWLWAVHLNPNARDVVFEVLGGLNNVKLIEPASYREFVYLMDGARLIISDSGGVQEEAPSLGKTVLVTRICTERPEAVKSGTSFLVGTDPDEICSRVDSLLNEDNTEIKKNPFGDGKAAERIIDVITKGSCQEF